MKPKIQRWVVVHDHTVVDISSGVLNLVSILFWISIISFASFFVENSQRVNKAGPKNPKVFALSYGRQFFFITILFHSGPSSKFPFLQNLPPSREAYVVGVDDSQYLLFFVKPPTRSPPLQQSGWIISGASRHDRSESYRLGSNHRTPTGNPICI